MGELSILMLEDEVNDARLAQHELRRAGIEFVARLVDNGEAFQAELDGRRPDIILADYSLPSFDGLSALKLARQTCPEVPFIFVSGAIGDERATQALKNGAIDYVLKDHLSRLGPAVQRALRDVEERTRRTRAEQITAATNVLLSLLPKKLSRKEYLDSVVMLLREWTGCGCVGVRVLNPQQQIPYEAYVGFSQSFWEAENWLSLERDQCACVRVLKGSPEPQDQTAITPAGSFCSLNLPEFVGGLTPAELARFRGRCVEEGYATLAIVPLRNGEQIIGALHLADKAAGKLSEPTFHLVEGLAPLIGETLHRLNVEEASRKNLEIQTVINGLLQVGNQATAMDDLLERSLDLILSVPWLATRGQGVILLADAGSDVLTIAARRGIAPQYESVFVDLAASMPDGDQCLWASELGSKAVPSCPDFVGCDFRCVPLVSGGRRLGVLIICVAGNPRDLHHEAFPRGIADALAGAIFRRLSERALRQHGQRLQILHAVDRAILSSQSEVAIASSVVRHLREVLAAPRVSITLYDDQRQELRILAVDTDLPTDLPAGRRLSPAVYPGLLLAQPDDIGEIEDLQAKAQLSPIGEILLAEGVRAYTMLPMVVDSQSIGYLGIGLDKPGRFPAEYLEVARQVADSLAVAIHNTRLLEQLVLSRQQLQDLSHRLVAAQEDERRSIARELHDEAGQGLTSVLIGLGLLQKEIQDGQAATARIADLKDTTHRIMEGLHRLAANLRPASLDRLGLVPALRQYLSDYGHQNGVEVEFHAAGVKEGQRLPANLETALYRIVQEALTNAARHARATQLGVILSLDGDSVRVIIEDDGEGFDVAEALQRGRLGLLGMRERAEMLGGTLTVESQVGSGTTVFATLPLGG